MTDHVAIDGEYRFVKVPVSLFTHPAVDASTLTLWCALWSFSDAQERSCYPSRRKLAERAGMSTDTVDRKMKVLTSLNLVTVEHRKTDDGDHTSNKYFLHPMALEGGGSKFHHTGGGKSAPTLGAETTT